MAKSKQKGNRFEADVAKTLSERFQERLGVEVGFRRTLDSGAFYGGSNATKTETHNLDYAVFGDIVSPRDFRFIIECKHYSTAPKLNSLFDGYAEWDGWIGEAEYDSKTSGKDWVLVMKYNHVKPMVIIETKHLDLSLFSHHIIYKTSYSVIRFEEFLKLEENFFFR